MTPKRLPFIALLMMLFGALKDFGLLIIASLFNLANNGGWQSRALVVGLLAVVIATSVINFLRFTYLIDDNGVTINSGIFVRKVEHIPYAKIQTVERQQWFFLKPFHLERVTIETSGKKDSDGEASLYAVPETVAALIEEKRASVAKTITANTPVETESLTAEKKGNAEDVTGKKIDAQYRISAHDLNLYALTSLGFVPIITGLIFLFNRFSEYAPKAWQKDLDEQLASLALITALIFIVLLLAIGLAISYFSLLQRYYHFTLTRRADTLTATRGLFKTTHVSVHINRIQALRFKQSLLRRPFKLSTVQALTASSAADEEADSDLVVLPVLPTEKALETTQQFISWLPLESPELTMVGRFERLYYLRNSVLFNLCWLLPAFLAISYWQPDWFVQAVVVILCWLLFFGFENYWEASVSGVAVVSPHLICVQTGSWLGRERFFIPRANVQSIRVKNSVWLAKKHRAHLELNVRTGNNNEEITVKYLPQAVAEQALSWYQPNSGNHFFL